MDSYDKLLKLTKNETLIWKKARGVAPNKTADKMDVAMLEWLNELTIALKIWIDKGHNMSSGELILARVNMGAVVESWLKFFYCVYYDDYVKNPILNKNKNKTIEPENATFEDLKNFSSDKLWIDKKSTEYGWVDSVQKKRNAIHAFRYREIGSTQDFLDDITHLFNFVNKIIDQFPPLEDYIESFPEGYERNLSYD